MELIHVIKPHAFNPCYARGRSSSRVFKEHKVLAQDTHWQKLRQTRMKIFDSRWLGAHGIGRFAAELRARLPGFEPIRLRGRPSSPLDPWLLRAYLHQRMPEFFFSPGYNAPAGARCPFAFCIHDLNHLEAPGSSSALKRSYYEHLIRPAIRRAAAVLTVSEFSRAAIREWAQVSGTNIVNVSNGVSDAFTAHGPATRFTRPYFLYVGSHKPHKNFGRLLQAFAASGLQGDYLLVSTGTASHALRASIAKLGLTEHVEFAGSVTDGELAALYRGATALVFVSLYEGFGLPVVEAMSCGTAVLTSSVTAMPEIAGTAAVLVDPSSTEAVVAALVQLASDSGLRRALRTRGLERAKLFSWDATARKVELALAGSFLQTEERACASH